MSGLRLSVAMGDYDRTRPIADGRVPIDGVDPAVMLLSPEELFFRAMRHQAFDICELSLSSYAMSVARGNPHYVAVPVFLSRAFRHTSIYIRTDRGIERPEDLRERRLGIAEYQLTANVWVRGILEQDYGVPPSAIRWVRGGMDTPGRPEKVAVDLPADVSLEAAPTGRTLNRMLADGEIDGFIGPRAIRCFSEGHPNVGRLFRDARDAAEAWYRRHRIFPIMHVLALRRALADEHPWLPGALIKAFTRAKDLAQEALGDTSAPKATLPFIEDNLERTRALMGRDFWSYGLAGNEKTLDTFLGYHFSQGLSARRVAPEELFHPASMEAFSL
ncbi:MAG: ABC transporter substrate-binding protein [Rhodospirillaceae bacterium]|nr:ABC transporter substrate-binding protein [Rhodospirillaceae bacterium]